MPTDETKNAGKTTELWAGLAAIIATVVAFDVPDKFKLAAVVAIVVAYTLSRGLAKQGIPHDPVQYVNSEDLEHLDQEHATAAGVSPSVAEREGLPTQTG